MGSDNFCLRWNDFESNMSLSFKELRQDREFFDVTLSCDEGSNQIQAHKVVLAACSPFFRRVLSRNPHQNPLIYLKGVDFRNLTAVLNFMYHGEVNVSQDELNPFLRVAEELAIKGLTDNKRKKEPEPPPPPQAAKSDNSASEMLKKIHKRVTSSGLIKNSAPASSSSNSSSPGAASASKKRKVDSASVAAPPAPAPPAPVASPPMTEDDYGEDVLEIKEVKPDLSALQRAGSVQATPSEDADNSVIAGAGDDDLSHPDGSFAADDDHLGDGSAGADTLEEYGYAQYGDESDYLDNAGSGDGTGTSAAAGVDGSKDSSSSLYMSLASVTAAYDPSQVLTVDPDLPQKADDFVRRDPLGTFWCGVCGQKGSHKHHLIRHVEAKHLNLCYKCTYCRKNFSARHLMMDHVRKYHRP